MCLERSRKQFSPLWRSSEDRASLFMSQKRPIESSFHHCGGPVKIVQACSCARKVLESGFHHCTAPVKLV